MDAALIGRAEDLEVAPDGTAYLLIYSDGAAHLERIRPDGTRTRIKLMGTEHVGEQIAVGPDGSVYVNLYVNGDHDAIHRIRPDGSRQVVIGYQTAASTSDGGSARTFGRFGGLTVDAQGRLVFAVGVNKEQTAGVLVRRVEAGGTARTIAGQLTTFDSYAEADRATPAAHHPPASGKAMDWRTTRPMAITELAAQPDGTIVLQTTDDKSGERTRAILAVTPSGAMHQIAEGSPARPAVTAAPFTPEGSVQTLGHLRSGISAADGLLAVTTTNKTAGPQEDTRYDWVGQYTEDQRAVLEESTGLAIRLLQPDGTVTTGAFGHRFALRDGHLYVVRRNYSSGRLLLGRVKLPA